MPYREVPDGTRIFYTDTGSDSGRSAIRTTGSGNVAVLGWFGRPGLAASTPTLATMAHASEDLS